MEANTRKLKILFVNEFNQAAATGTTGPSLYAVAKALCRFMSGHVQTNEGLNSSIKRLACRCPNIGLPLLSARINIAHALGVGTRHGGETKLRWSNIRNRAAKLLAQCNEIFPESVDISRDPARWSGAGVAAIPEDEVIDSIASDVNPHVQITLAKKFAALHTLSLHKHFKQPEVRHCFSICLPACRHDFEPTLCDGGSVYICADKNYSLASLVACDVTFHQHDGRRQRNATLSVPFKHCSSQDVFAECYKTHFETLRAEDLRDAPELYVLKHKVVGWSRCPTSGAFVAQLCDACADERLFIIRRPKWRSRRVKRRKLDPAVPVPAEPQPAEPNEVAEEPGPGPDADDDDADLGTDDEMLGALAEELDLQAQGVREAGEDEFADMATADAANADEEIVFQHEAELVAEATAAARRKDGVRGGEREHVRVLPA